MHPMTHGEIRGTIMLLILLAAIVLSAALLRGCNEGPGLPAESHGSQPTPQAVDSLRMEMSASRYDSSTVKSCGKTSRDSVAARASDAKSRKKQRKATSSRRPSPSPTPSPLDRPV
ncbi:MAG: hypothetical protein K2L39_05990 [Muribaculaceae bacterium]|nr:hypothetical protein [Muribaculaceae bacterium]